MKRLFAIMMCTLLLAASAAAQGLQERNLGETAPPTPSAQVTPAQGAQAAPQTQYAPAPQGATQSPYASPAQGAQTAPQNQYAAPAQGAQTAPPPAAAQTPPPPAPSDGATPPHPKESRSRKYTRAEVHQEVMNFFDGGSAGLAELVAKAFKDMGQPSGYIKGSEAGGALLVGLRYGTGYLYIKNHKPIEVFWQSPSVGIDLGINAVRVFTLVYGMDRPDEIFRRFPGVDGSAYFIGGFGMNYQTSDGLVLAPIRFGVGLRLGANVGYQHYTRTQEINPF
jgi:hypothetical protein